MNLTTPFTLPFCAPPHAYTPSRCSCQRCKKVNQCPKLFSSDNNMDPGSVPAELQGLSQTEEMLIARCCPIMRAPTFSPWAHRSDDSYIYQLSLVLATASVSLKHSHAYRQPAQHSSQSTPLPCFSSSRYMYDTKLYNCSNQCICVKAFVRWATVLVTG